MCLWLFIPCFLGPGQWGTGGSHRHIYLASPILCPLVALAWRDLYPSEHWGSGLAMKTGPSSPTTWQFPRVDPLWVCRWGETCKTFQGYRGP